MITLSTSSGELSVVVPIVHDTSCTIALTRTHKRTHTRTQPLHTQIYAQAHAQTQTSFISSVFSSNMCYVIHGVIVGLSLSIREAYCFSEGMTIYSRILTQ